MSEKMGKHRSDATQTDSSSIDRHYTKSQSTTTVNSQANLMESDENNGKNRESMRSTGQREATSQQAVAQSQQSSNPFVNQPTNDQRQSTSQENSSLEQSYHVHYPTSTYSEDVIETQTLPSAQNPVFSKVKQNPTILNHFETEPYKKILTRSNQPNSYTRYHDTAQQHHRDPTFYDDFDSYRKQTYYQGPKVDQGKLVIRDYSQQSQKPHTCNCQNQNCEENEGQEQQSSDALKPGYVSQVAKLWDDRMKSNQGSVRSHQKDIKGLNTIV